MRATLAGLLLSTLIAAPALAGQPVTINNPANSQSALVTNNALSTTSGCIYNASPVSISNGARSDSQCDTHASLKFVGADPNGFPIDATLPVQIYQSDSYLNIAAGTASTVVKSGAGTFDRLNINTKGASANVITVFDNTTCTGTLIATIDGTSDRDHTFGLAFSTGLCIKSTTGTGADMTAVFR